MGIYAVKPAFQRLLRPTANRLAAAGMSADALTWAGLVFCGIGGVAFWLGRDGTVWLLGVAVAALLRTIANALDGMVAVATGSSHPLGEWFNEVADRVGDAVFFLPIMTVTGVPDPLVAGTLAVVLTVSFAGNAVKAAGGERIYGGVMGKPDRMFLLGSAALIGFGVEDHSVAIEVVLWIILAGAVATFVARMRMARKLLR